MKKLLMKKLLMIGQSKKKAQPIEQTTSIEPIEPKPIEPKPISKIDYNIMKERVAKETETYYINRLNELYVYHIKTINGLLRYDALTHKCANKDFVYVLSSHNPKHNSSCRDYVNDKDEIILINKLTDYIIKQYEDFNPTIGNRIDYYIPKLKRYEYEINITFKTSALTDIKINGPNISTNI